MRYRELECEACQTRLKLALPSAKAWHASCPKRTARGVLPRYRPVNAQASESGNP